MQTVFPVRMHFITYRVNIEVCGIVLYTLLRSALSTHFLRFPLLLAQIISELVFFSNCKLYVQRSISALCYRNLNIHRCYFVE
jgi:hypothetical protein